MKDLSKEFRETEVLSVNVRNETKESIKKKMREVDTREWKREMDQKSSLKIHRK